MDSESVTPSEHGSSCEPELSFRIFRDSSSVILWVEDSVTDVLGWTPEEVKGQPSTSFIHPDDISAAVTSWFEMLARPGGTATFRGRYRAADGSWRWLQIVNENLLETSDPHVVSTISPITVHEVTIEEELRERKLMLTLLADALPLGVFQFDLGRRITFANDRLHALVGTDSFATLEAALSCLDDADATILTSAIDAALSGASFDALELHATERHSSGRPCVFELSLRPLTAGDGAVTGVIGCLSDVTERVRMRRALEEQATRDALTGSFNRSAILNRLDETLEAMRPGDGVAVLFVDLDDFKSTNDDYGHAAGDAVLMEASRRIASQLRRNDAMGRLGGDEFLVICTGVTERDIAEQVSNRVRAALEGPVRIGNHTVPITATIGFAWTDGPAPRDLLVSEADHRMYRDKRGKRNIAA